jgi:hypothetical protein
MEHNHTLWGYLSSGNETVMDSQQSHIDASDKSDEDGSGFPARPAADSPRPPLVPEHSDFLDGDPPAADKVQAFLAHALEATGSDADQAAAALVPWICDALLSNRTLFALLVVPSHKVPTPFHATEHED